MFVIMSSRFERMIGVDNPDLGSFMIPRVDECYDFIGGSLEKEWK